MDKNDGYSFTYYDDDDDLEMNPYIERGEYLINVDGSSKKSDSTLELARTGSLPIMVDASRPSIQRPR